MCPEEIMYPQENCREVFDSHPGQYVAGESEILWTTSHQSSSLSGIRHSVDTIKVYTAFSTICIYLFQNVYWMTSVWMAVYKMDKDPGPPGVYIPM